MLKNETVNYINNLAKMASTFASGTGKSVIAVEAYEKKNYLSDFVARYQILAEHLALQPSEHALSDIMKRWLCGKEEGSRKDRWIARRFGCLLERYAGEPKTVYVLGENRSVLAELSKMDGEGPRYVVEDLLFAVYKEGTLCFLLGHGA